MLTIKQTRETQEIKALCVRAGIPYADKLFCFAARSSGQTLGGCLYTVERDGITILAVECGGDGPLFDGLVRSVFWSASQLGLETARFGPQADKAMLRQYRFTTDRTEIVDSMTQFLEQCKNCKNP